MRKNLTIVFGLVLLGGVVMTGVFASAQRYHQYLYQQKNSHVGQESVTRYHNYRQNLNARKVGAYRTRPTSRRLDADERPYNDIAHVKSNTRATVGAGGVGYGDYSDGNEARNENTRASNRLVIRNGQYQYKYPVVTDQYVRDSQQNAQDYVVSPEAISFGNALGFAADDEGVYRSSNTSLAFRALEFPESKCTESNFRSCVATVARNYRSSLGADSAHLYDFAWRQTKLNDFTYFLTYRETFYKGGNVYFLFYALNPVTGNLVRVESVAFASQEDKSAKQAHKVFETLRFN